MEQFTQTSIKPEKIGKAGKMGLAKMNDKEREEHIQRQIHKRKLHKAKNLDSRYEWKEEY